MYADTKNLDYVVLFVFSKRPRGLFFVCVLGNSYLKACAWLGRFPDVCLDSAAG